MSKKENTTIMREVINMAKSKFQTIMGSSPDIKVLEYLIEWKHYDMNITDIANGSGVSRPKVYQIVKRLHRKKILTKGDKQKGSQYYWVSSKHPVIKKLWDIYQWIVNN